MDESNSSHEKGSCHLHTCHRNQDGKIHGLSVSIKRQAYWDIVSRGWKPLTDGIKSRLACYYDADVVAGQG